MPSYLIPTPARGVVSFRASFETYPNLLVHEDLIQRLTVRLLDKGTQRRDRFAFADALEHRGATLAFTADEARVGFAGRCLRDDLDAVLDLAAEALNAPLLDASEAAKVVMQLDAAYRHAEEDTAAQADAALSRLLYAEGHPNYAEPFDVTRAAVAALSADDAQRFHHDRFGRGALDLAVAGDVEGLDGDDLLARFGERAPAPTPAVWPATPDAAPRVADVAVPGKTSFDVRLGHVVPLTRPHPDYLPLRVALFALGGNFSARLMQTVRDRDGLTYGIGASLEGASATFGGHALVRANFSPDVLDRGLVRVREEVQRLVDEGLGDAELDTVRQTLAGTHVVGLSTSGGAAAAQLAAIEYGLGADWLTVFPELLAELTPERVNDVLRRYLHPERLSVALAGTPSADAAEPMIQP
ncbi:MAG: insulinase family protein [Bacteroidetes bacterium]|nr:insulinase family protein [Bacteroidota bacterium]